MKHVTYAIKKKWMTDNFILNLSNMLLLTYSNLIIYKIIHASEYYTSRAKLRRKKYAKLSIGADVLQHIVCSIKIRRAPTRHDNIDFRPLITRIAKIKPLSVVVADKAYDSEDNHVLVREKLNGFSIIPSRYEKDVPIWKTRGKYRKELFIQ